MGLVVSRFDFEGWNWVLIASVPGFCVQFAFINFYMKKISDYNLCLILALNLNNGQFY